MVSQVFVPLPAMAYCRWRADLNSEVKKDGEEKLKNISYLNLKAWSTYMVISIYANLICKIKGLHTTLLKSKTHYMHQNIIDMLWRKLFTKNFLLNSVIYVPMKWICHISPTSETNFMQGKSVVQR